MSFSVSDKPPRHRNVLHGRIRNGVLTTDPAEIELTETWGQGGARDIRGSRSSYHYFKGRMKLEFHVLDIPICMTEEPENVSTKQRLLE